MGNKFAWTKEEYEITPPEKDAAKAFNFCSDCAAAKACAEPIQDDKGRFAGCKRGKGSGGSGGVAQISEKDEDFDPFATDIGPDEEGFVQAPVDRIEHLYVDPQLTKQEKAAIAAYTSEFYIDINRSLRHGYDSRASTLPKEDIDIHVKHLDSAVQKMELPADQTLYRGLRRVKVKEGDVVNEKGFVSTSVTPSAANSFATMSPSSPGVIIALQAKKGQKGLLIDNRSSNDGEREVLLPRNISYRITKDVTPADLYSRNVKIFEAEILE